MDLVKMWEESRKRKDPLIEAWFRHIKEKRCFREKKMGEKQA